jgi:hypothetical protein
LAIWDSKNKMSIGCGRRGEAHSILSGGRWWLPPSPGRGESCESGFARGSSQNQKCLNYALTNLLFGFVQIHVSEQMLVIFPSPILELQHTPLPLKVLRAKECAPTFCSFVVSL